MSLPKPLSKTTIALHWIVGIFMIVLFGVGQYMSEFEVWSLAPTHKSIGMLVLLIILPRVVWRVIEGWPEPVAPAPQWQERIAKAVHWALILATLAMPLSGMMMSGAGGHGLHIFGFELLAANPNPNNPAEMLPLNAALAGAGHLGHEVWSKVLHVAGALKHHLVDKDTTLKRMLGKSL